MLEILSCSLSASEAPQPAVLHAKSRRANLFHSKNPAELSQGCRLVAWSLGRFVKNIRSSASQDDPSPSLRYCSKIPTIYIPQTRLHYKNKPPGAFNSLGHHNTIQHIKWNTSCCYTYFSLYTYILYFLTFTRFVLSDWLTGIYILILVLLVLFCIFPSFRYSIIM